MNTNTSTPAHVIALFNQIATDPFAKGTKPIQVNELGPHNLSLLIDTLVTNGVTLKTSQRFNLTDTPTKVYRLDAPYKPTRKAKTGPEATWQEVTRTLKNLVSTDELRPAMCCVYFDKDRGNIVATDAYKIVIIKHPSLDTFEQGTMINPYTGKQDPTDINGTGLLVGRYPNYQAVIPTQHQYEAGISLDSLKATAKAAITAGKVFNPDSWGKPPVFLSIQLPDGNVWHGNPEFIFDTCEALTAFGYSTAQAQFSTVNRGMLLSGPEFTALIMPVFVEGKDDENPAKLVPFDVF